MNENTALWDKLGRTDPAHTKEFTRAGGFKGTAIKPIWSYRRMTEEFGPCGEGWGVNEPKYELVPAGEEILVFCTVTVWLQTKSDDSSLNLTRPKLLVGVGGDKVLSKTRNGLGTDDEAFKKAFTDAVTNALKFIGVGADVHMGMFDDSKYVNTVENEFKAERAEKAANGAPKPISAAEQKRQLLVIDAELLDCHSTVAVDTCAKTWQHIATRDGWSKDYKLAAAEKFKARREMLLQQEDTVSDIQDEFPGARVTNEHVHPLMAGE